MLAHQDAQRIGLLAGGASRHPDTHGVVGAAPLEQLRDNQFFQRREGFLVAKEVGDVDQQIAEQRSQFVRFLPQHVDVGFHRM